MSGIVGPDGSPVKSEVERKKYAAGGLAFEHDALPEQLLTKALNQARQAIGTQAYQQAMQRVANAAVANIEAQTAASNVKDPFLLEPAAMAVFMYLCREIEYRDEVIAQINKRLENLGATPLDLEHPYPEPEIIKDETNSEESEGEVESSGDEGDSAN